MDFSFVLHCLGNLQKFLLQCYNSKRSSEGCGKPGKVSGSAQIITGTPSNLGELGDFSFALATPEDKESVGEFLSQNFFPVEPMGKALCIDPAAEVNRWLPRLIGYQINEGISFTVRERLTRKLVAVCLNTIETKEPNNEAVDIFQCVHKDTEPNMWKITRLLNDLVEDVDLFRMFSLDSYVVLGILSVSPECGGKGLGRKLIELTEWRAKDLGYKLIISEATSDFSARAFKKAGFRSVKQIAYAEYQLHGEKPFDGNTGIHQKAELVVKAI